MLSACWHLICKIFQLFSHQFHIRFLFFFFCLSSRIFSFFVFVNKDFFSKKNKRWAGTVKKPGYEGVKIKNHENEEKLQGKKTIWKSTLENHLKVNGKRKQKEKQTINELIAKAIFSVCISIKKSQLFDAVISKGNVPTIILKMYNSYT